MVKFHNSYKTISKTESICCMDTKLGIRDKLVESGCATRVYAQQSVEVMKRSGRRNNSRL